MGDPRQELISNGVLAVQGGLYQFTQDYTFSVQEAEAGQYFCFCFDSCLRNEHEG